MIGVFIGWKGSGISNPTTYPVAGFILQLNLDFKGDGVINRSRSTSVHAESQKSGMVYDGLTFDVRSTKLSSPAAVYLCRYVSSDLG